MHTEIHKWFSPNLGKEMELKVYGHYGQAFISFPCSKGRYFDFEGQGMIAKISHFIESGKIKLYAIDSYDNESIYNFSIPAGERSARSDAYYKYVTDEVIPFIRNHNNSPEERPMLTGTSMGAYHAVNLFVQRPDVCGGTIALSGLYRLDRKEFNVSPDEIKYCYYNSPIHNLPNVNEEWKIDWYKKSNIIICCGTGAYEDEAIEDTKDIEYSFKAKGVPVCIEYWGKEVNHDWPWWFKQMNHFLGKLYN